MRATSHPAPQTLPTRKMAAPDIAIIGGGASGLAAAITAARRGARVTVVERDVAAGLPILATGNGRCNLSNARLDPVRYRHPDIARAVMGPQPERDVSAFFEGLGLLMAEEGEGRLYPRTRRAESVRDVLLGACAREGIVLRCGAEVSAARHDRQTGTWALTVSEPVAPLHPKTGHDPKAALRHARKALAAAPRTVRQLRAQHVIIACGGASGAMAKLFGLPHLSEAPALCPIACTPATLPDNALALLDGLRVEAACTLLRDGQPVAREQGELLFRSYGVSGIAVFNLSRRAHTGDTLEVDLFPELAGNELAALLAQRSALLGTREAYGSAWFDGLLAPALARVIATAGDACRQADGTSLATMLKHLAFAVTGPAEPRQAQVRRGGIPFDALALPSLTARPAIAPALSACGEATDMDADCGGYNLAWAWLSGIRAGKEAARA